MIAVLLAIAIIALPQWPYSRQWGYVPCAGIALLAMVLLLMHVLYMI